MLNESQQLDAELKRLRDNGLTLPRHPYAAMQFYKGALDVNREASAIAERDLTIMGRRLGRPITASNYSSPEVQRILQENKALANAMGQKRALSVNPKALREARLARLYPGMPKTGMTGGTQNALGGDIYTGLPRFYDPLEYWDLSGLPWNTADEGHRHKLHKWLRLYYATHYLVPILIDIFTRFPLVGAHLEHKDPLLIEVYEDVFFQQLKYEDFLVDLGRDTWLVGESFPLGHFDEDLGIWTHEELINPETVVIDNFPLLDTQQLKIVPPDYLRRIAQTQSPAREWYMLQQHYSELVPYLLKGEHIPISPVLFRQVANKLNPWDDHGTPILLRALRTLIHEEKLLASQDATAERLYSPFILAKLGIMDMGDGLPPWIPTPDELQAVREDLDMTMASDFRLMVHHFGLELTSVFGRENMPRLDDDFDRVERRIMECFGVNPSLLSAGSNTEPYASSALHAEFMNQILRTFQKTLKEHYRERAMVMAEAQGHYAYELKGQTRIPIYETVIEWDEEGNKRLVKKQKLTCPKLEFEVLDLRDEATERQFLMTLRQAGVPIPDEKLMVGVSWKKDDFVDQYNRDIIHKTLSQQQAKMDTYIACVIRGIPIPMDLKFEVESVLQQPGGEMGMGGGGGMPGEGGPNGQPGMQGMMPPGGGSIDIPPPPPGLLGPSAQEAPPGGGTPPAGPVQPGAAGNVPEVSNERRPGLTYNTPFKSSVTASIVENSGPKTDEAFNAIISSWPENFKKRAQELKYAFDTTGKMPIDEPLVEEEETPEDEGDDPANWKLKPRQRVSEHEGQTIILESTKRTEIKVTPEKKYSVIDPVNASYKSPKE